MSVLQEELKTPQLAENQKSEGEVVPKFLLHILPPHTSKLNTNYITYTTWAIVLCVGCNNNNKHSLIMLLLAVRECIKRKNLFPPKCSHFIRRVFTQCAGFCGRLAGHILWLMLSKRGCH